MTIMYRHGITIVNNKISRYRYFQNIAKTVVSLSPTYRIADFYCEDFNVVIWALRNIKLATYFITWSFSIVSFFSICKTAVLEHSPTNQVLVYSHNSLLIVYSGSISVLVPLYDTCFFTKHC